MIYEAQRIQSIELCQSPKPLIYMSKYILVILSILFIESTAVSQKLAYDVIWKDDVIGSFEITKESSSNQEVYDIISDVMVKFFGEKHIYTTHHTVYEKNEMTSSVVDYKRNDKPKGYAKIKRLNAGYDIEVDDDVVVFASTYPVVYSTSKLYFSPPENRRTVFSERRGVDLSVRKDGPNQYTVTKPDGRETVYYYKAGVANRIEVGGRFASFTMKLK